MAGLLAPMFLSVFKNGQVLIGGKIKAFEPGTTTAKAIYQDAELTTPWSSSIATTDSNGLAKVYLDIGNYRLDFHDTDANGGGFLYRLDPVQGGTAGITVQEVSASTTINSTQNNYIFAGDATDANITLTLPDVTTVGDGFKLTVSKIDSTANTVTLAAFSGQTIAGNSTLTISIQYEAFNLISYNGNWILGDTTKAIYNSELVAALQVSGSGSNTGLDLAAAGTGQVLVDHSDTRTNTVAAPSVIRSGTSGVPAAGIGVGQLYQAESADETPSDFGQIEFVSSDVAAGSEDTFLRILTRRAGAVLAAAWDFVVTTAFKYVFTGSPTADRTITLPDANVDLTEPTQAQMETATSTTLRVSPAKQKFHPLHPKAWAKVGGTGTAAILADEGFASLTDNGTGDYTLTFDTAFSSTGYSAIATGISGGANIVTVINVLAGSVTVKTFNTAGAATDLDFMLVVLGDQ